MTSDNFTPPRDPVAPAQPAGNGQLDAGPPAAPLAGEDVAARLARMEKLLEKIVDHQYQVYRERQVREFSLSDLGGAVCLVVSVVFVVGAVLSLLRTDAFLGRAWATVAFLGAIAMQGLGLTLFLLSRRK